MLEADQVRYLALHIGALRAARQMCLMLEADQVKYLALHDWSLESCKANVAHVEVRQSAKSSTVLAPAYLQHQ